MKKVSILIPAYNVQDYIKESIESIVNQTYKNIEIIIVDDGSTDETYSILKQYAKIDDRILLLRNKANLKIVKTLNKALSCASGEYIARMDGDDISELDRIEKFVDYLENNKEVDLIGCSLRIIGPNGEFLGTKKFTSNQLLMKNTLKYVSPVSHVWLARKSVYLNLNGYRDLPGAEDYDFLLRMITSGYGISNIEDYYGYHVRIGRSGNTINTISARQLKLHQYVYRLYKQRKNSGYDNFNEKSRDKITNIPSLLLIIHQLSSKFLYKAIKYKKRNIFLSTLFVLASVISPFQIIYLTNRLIYRLKLRLIK